MPVLTCLLRSLSLSYNIEFIFLSQKLLRPLSTPFIDPFTDDAATARHALLSASWAVSSAVEHFVDIEGVTSSILVPPTIVSLFRFSGAPANPGAGHVLDEGAADWRQTNEGQELAPLAQEPAP